MTVAHFADRVTKSGKAQRGRSLRFLPELDRRSVAYTCIIGGALGLSSEIAGPDTKLGRLALFAAFLALGIFGVVRHWWIRR